MYVLQIHIGYFAVEKMSLNVDIKAFYCTNNIFLTTTFYCYNLSKNCKCRHLYFLILNNIFHNNELKLFGILIR